MMEFDQGGSGVRMERRDTDGGVYIWQLNAPSVEIAPYNLVAVAQALLMHAVRNEKEDK